MKWYEIARKECSQVFLEVKMKPSVHDAADLPAGTKLFVGNLPTDITEEALNYAGS